MNAADNLLWDEDAAHAQVREWFNRIGDGGEESWAVLNDPAAPLLEQFGVDICAALDAGDWTALEAAWATFRRGFGQTWTQHRTKAG